MSAFTPIHIANPTRSHGPAPDRFVPLRAIAGESGISTGSLLHHFGSRERVLTVAAGRTGRALVRAIESDSLWIGVDAFLPGDDEMALLTRAWLAWCELWRSEPWLEDSIS